MRRVEPHDVKPKQVATRFGVREDTVYKWIEAGLIEAVDVSTTGKPCWRFSEAALVRFAEARSNARAKKAPMQAAAAR